MHRLRRPRVLLSLSAAMVVAIGAVFVVPSFADSNAVPQRLLDQLQNCKDILAAAQSAHQKAWGHDCVNGTQAAINAWLKAHPTPTATATTPPGTTPPVTTPPDTTPPDTTPPDTTPPVTSPSTTPPVSPGSDPWPTAANTGVPAGWVPASTQTSDLRVTTAGAVIHDIRLVNANLLIDADNVTVRNVEVQGGRIENWPRDTCRKATLLDHVSVVRSPGQRTNDEGTAAVGTGGYTASYVKIDGLPEGFRAGGVSDRCGPVVIDHSYVHAQHPDSCTDWHGDGLQGYDGPAVTVRHSTLWLDETPNCGGTAPFFYPRDQGNTSAIVDGLIVRGGGFSFRDGMPGTVAGLHVVANQYLYGPIDVACSRITSWQADIVTLDADGQPHFVRTQPCNTESGT